MTIPHLIGWVHTRFGKVEQPDVETLMAEVAAPALAAAGLGPADVDAVSVGVRLSGVVVDPDGAVHAGELVAGAHLVAVTFERLVVEGES